MEDEISKKQNQKTQNINVRISPATKADVITKAAALDLTISEYVEYVLTNEENSNLRILGERRKGEEIKDAYENRLSELKSEFQTLELESANFSERMGKLTNVLYVERIKNIEADKNTLQLINLMKEAIVSSEEAKEQLDFFAENTKLKEILYTFTGEEFVYYNNGKREKMIPETIEDIFSILVSDFHSKLNLHKNESELDAIEANIVE